MATLLEPKIAIPTRAPASNAKSTIPIQDLRNAYQKISPTNKPMPDIAAPITGLQRVQRIHRSFQPFSPLVGLAGLNSRMTPMAVLNSEIILEALNVKADISDRPLLLLSKFRIDKFIFDITQKRIDILILSG